MCKRHFLSVGFLLCVVVAGPVLAEPVEFTFQGTIDLVLGTFNPPFDSVAAGDEYTFQFVFESTTPDSEGAPTLGVYLDPIQSFVITIGGASMTDTPDVSYIAVDDETVPGLEFYEVGIGVLTFVFGGQSGLPTGTLSSDALPTTFELGDLSSFQFSVFDVMTEGSAIGSLTSFSDGDENGNGDEIPAASTWGLSVLGLLLLVGAKISFGRGRAAAA